jgi:hypothetical protein
VRIYTVSPRLDFGRYKGKPLRYVPTAYLTMLVGLPALGDDLKSATRDQLILRGVAAADPGPAAEGDACPCHALCFARGRRLDQLS